MHAIGAVIMAAGAGRRMGNVPKPLLRRDGEPLLLRQVRLAVAAGADYAVVVLGHHAERLAAALADAQSRNLAAWRSARVAWATNPDPDRGTGSSLRCGLAALPPGLAAWLVLLGDQPLLETEDVRTMLDAWNRRAASIELVVPMHAGQPGHPVVFGRGLRGALLDDSGERGVREWRRAHPQRVAKMPVGHARCTTDIDTPDDLDCINARYGVRLDWPDGHLRPQPAD
ncbi:MAG TPA: nucleotidyltransferase family protein [Rhodanobacteraceae bacterium]